MSYYTPMLIEIKYTWNIHINNGCRTIGHVNILIVNIDLRCDVVNKRGKKELTGSVYQYRLCYEAGNI